MHSILKRPSPYNLRKDPPPSARPYKLRHLNGGASKEEPKLPPVLQVPRTTISLQLTNTGYKVIEPACPKQKRLIFTKKAEKRVVFADLAAESRLKNLFPLEEHYMNMEPDPLDLSVLGQRVPVPETAQLQQVPQEDEPEELEIVNNRNQKVKIRVSGLTGKTQLKGFEGVPNGIDFASRQAYFEGLRLQSDFRSGYAPIEIQESQERDFSALQKDKTQHFIRKKQSCAAINLKRTCGVSYVKRSESQQLNVSDVFPLLPPLVFQCSSECDDPGDISLYQPAFQRLFAANNPLLPQKPFGLYVESRSQKDQHIVLVSKPVPQPEKRLLCSVLEADEEVIRDYLLNPEHRPALCKGRVFLARDYKDLWPFFVDKLFIIVHFFHDPEEVIVNRVTSGLSFKELMSLIKISQFQLGILLKRNLCGKKSFIKTLGTDFNLFMETSCPETVPQEENHEILDFDAKAGTVSSLDDVKPIKVETVPKQQPNKQVAPPNAKPKFLDSLMSKLQGFFSKPAQAVPERASANNSNGFSTGVSSPVSYQPLESDPIKRNILGVHPSILAYLQKEPKMKNINAISVRMELFIEEALWKSLSDPQKNDLNGLILHIDDSFQRQALQMSNLRMDVYESPSPQDFNSALSLLTLVCEPETRPVVLTDLFPNAIARNKTKEIASFALPLYYISTRDCFAFDLVEKTTVLQLPGRPNVLKTEYFFHPKGRPQNFKAFEAEFPDFRVGVTSYSNFFSHEELLALEAKTFDTEIKCFKKHFLPMTAQATFTSEKVRRTKFFFGVRYMWSKQQIAEPYSHVAAGVRSDVSPPPQWLKSDIEGPLVEGGIIPQGFVNSITMNVYHDGKEGLAQHFDDAVRFKQPIFSVRLFSDCRLSFGSQFYGFCNGAFCIPLPRGCIAVLEENSYAANGVKHCVRPCDMTGKSAAIILRQMHEKCLTDAKRLAEFVDLPAWVSTLSLDERAVSYDEQKRIEAEANLAGGCRNSKTMATY